MKEQFDKKLVDKIKDSFQQHEEPFDLQEFEKFKKLYFGRNNNVFKRIGGFWWMGIAASLILGLFFLSQLQFNENVQNGDSLDLLTSNGPSSFDNLKSTENLKEEQYIEREHKSIEDSHTKAQAKSSEQLLLISPKNVQIRKEEMEVKGSLERVLPTTPAMVDNSENRNDINIAPENPESLESLPKRLTLTLDNKDEENVEEYINKWLGGVAEIEEKKTIAKNESKTDPIKLGVLLAPQTISNATQAVNLGAGMMSEFSFSKRLKLDVGVAYARQQITPGNSNRDFLGVSEAYSSSNALDVATIQSESARAAFSGNFINASTELSFGQLEIPINLKYKVLENKNSDVYFISGFSNMMYLNQQNTTTFSTANLNYGTFVGMQSAIQTYTQTEVPNTGSGNVDTGQMLNFGFGFEQSLKNGTFLSIEPFYKFSLGDQTFNNQQFSIGGINLRMNFQLKNKKE